VRLSIASPLTRASPFCRRVGIRTSTFEACSGFTHVTARRIAQPPKAAFVTRLRSGWSPNQTARQLPEQSTTLWVDPPSTGETRPRGALHNSRLLGQPSVATKREVSPLPCAVPASRLAMKEPPRLQGEETLPQGAVIVVGNGHWTNPRSGSRVSRRRRPHDNKCAGCHRGDWIIRRSRPIIATVCAKKLSGRSAKSEVSDTVAPTHSTASRDQFATLPESSRYFNHPKTIQYP
jgi:hypothetical protein